MTDKEKLKKIKSLADKMYTAMQYLTTDTTSIRKAMYEYHQFIITKFHEEEPVSEDLDIAASQYVLDPNNFVDWIGNHGETDDISYILRAYKTGANWQKQHDTNKACEWWKDEFTYPSMTETEIDWYKEKIEEFRKAMENGVRYLDDDTTLTNPINNE